VTARAMSQDHQHYMRLALEQARAAGEKGNRPVASIIVRDDRILGAGENAIYTDLDPSAHAEIAAIRDACAKLKTVDLAGSTLYTTLEPCPMCFWAMQEARIGTLVMGGRYQGIGRTDMGRYTVESFLEFTGRPLEVITGVLQRECEEVRLQWQGRMSKRV
jgi:tRNA(Arg) A34 adenosine deaminase TadA